jgi:MFS family permease
MNEPVVSKSSRSALLIVFLVVFIDLLGFGIVLPLMPIYAREYLHGYDETTRGAIIGALYSSFSLMQFLFSPIWGRVSDRIGRRPILLLGLVGSVVFYALFAYASTIPAEQSTLAIGLLLTSRVGAGIAGASVSTASAVIADSTPPEKRSQGMALIGAAFGIGFTFGPLIAYAGLSLFTDARWAPGAIASGLSLIATLLAAVLLPETLKPENVNHQARGFSFGRSLAVLKMPTVGPPILAYFLAIFAFANFEATLALFTTDVFRFDERENFLVFTGVGLVLMIAQGGFYRRFAGKMSEVGLIRGGLVMMFVGLGGLAVVAYFAWQLKQTSGTTARFEWVMYLAAAVAVFGFAFVNPSVAALVSRRADPTRQGEILGVNQSFAALGRILGPFVGSVMFEQHPSRTLPYAVAVAVLMLVVLMLPVIGRSSVLQPGARATG